MIIVIEIKKYLFKLKDSASKENMLYKVTHPTIAQTNNVIKIIIIIIIARDTWIINYVHIL